ncbi:MAG TPA: DUF58 domain-containing protein [Planctomycetota bacterium]|nr:DUF58 domain-containing protein [Planctomycetota bacterium]
MTPPQARVHWPAAFAHRVASFASAQAAVRRTPREGASSSAARIGAGSGEFAGRRRYRPGEDLRAFDWEAEARGAGSWVRLSRQESGEPWAVLLDSSASMAVGADEGAPKIQLAAELALALCAVGLFSGGTVTLVSARGVLTLRSKADFPRAVAELDDLECAGTCDFASWLAHRSLARAARCIAVGDFLDADPALARGRRRFDALCVLATVELAPLARLALDERVLWRDPETLATLDARLGAVAVARYANLLEEHHRHWRASVRRAGGEFVLARAGDDFEPHALHLLRARRA